MESTCRNYSANEFGEFDTITDASWALCLDDFVQHGLAPFLEGRPAHLHQVDLLHIIAMAIHPQPLSTTTTAATTPLIPDTAATSHDKHFWKRAKKLILSNHARCFHVNYGRRIKLIHLITRHLVIPPLDPEVPMINGCPLYAGALPHLRASLHAFSVGAMAREHAYWARSAVVSIFNQSRIEWVLKEEWELLIHNMVDDRTQYPGCKHCHQMLRYHRFRCIHRTINDKQQLAAEYPTMLVFCPHAARGIHLTEILIRTCESRRSDVGRDFLYSAFSSLSDAVEWQMHCWKQPEDAEPLDSEEPSCMLASLLFAAKDFFYFLLPTEELENRKNGHSGIVDIFIRRDELIVCALQLIHHFDASIATEAAELAALAFAYSSQQHIEKYATLLLRSLELAIPNMFPLKSKQSSPCRFLLSSIRKVVSAASRLSPPFAMSFTNLMLELLAKEISENEKGLSADEEKDDDGKVSMNKETGIDEKATRTKQGCFLRLLASVSISNPIVTAEKTHVLIALLKGMTERSSQFEAIAALMPCRQARFFEREKSSGYSALLKVTKQMDNRWDLYKIACLSLRTGNFAAASQCYHQILESALSERYFLWVSALANVADSELCLSRFAAKGIPLASTSLRSALSLLQTLKALDQPDCSDFSLQIMLVSLRLDFLDLLAGLRQLIREMRLTGTGPAQRTRSFLHFQNITRCFDAHARRYWNVYKRYGLFSCQQSRTSLRTLHTLSRFLARSVRCLFSDTIPLHKKKESWPVGHSSGDMTLPISRFMHHLEDRLHENMSLGLDPVVRAAVMIELLDGVLLCPAPFPTCFIAVAVLPAGRLYLSPDLEQSAGADGLCSVGAYPGVSFVFCARGVIPSSFLNKAQLPITAMLLKYRTKYVGPIQEDEHYPEDKQEDEHMADEKEEEEGQTERAIARPWDYNSVSTSLLANGTYSFEVACSPIREEGIFSIEVELGCCDIRGGEWEVPVFDRGNVVLQVSRSNWHG